MKASIRWVLIGVGIIIGITLLVHGYKKLSHPWPYNDEDSE